MTVAIPGANRLHPTEAARISTGRKPLKTLAFWAVIILLSFWAFNYYFGTGRDTVEITYTDLQNQILAGNVSRVTFEERRVSGDFKNDFTKKVGNQTVTAKKFTSMIPFASDSELLKLMEDHDVPIEAKAVKQLGQPADRNPPLALFNIFLDLHASPDAGRARREFSRLENQRLGFLTGSRPKVTFADVAGCDEAKQELEEIIEFLKDPGKFQKLAEKSPKARCF